LVLRLLVCRQIHDLAEQAEPLGEEDCRTALLAITTKLVPHVNAAGAGPGAR